MPGLRLWNETVEDRYTETRNQRKGYFTSVSLSRKHQWGLSCYGVYVAWELRTHETFD